MDLNRASSPVLFFAPLRLGFAATGRLPLGAGGLLPLGRNLAAPTGGRISGNELCVLVIESQK